jgi:hypothetical protein
MAARPLALAILAACVALFAIPCDAQQAPSRTSRDSTWEPQVYGFSGVQAPGGTGVTNLKPNGGGCMPTPRKVAEGQCSNGVRTVAYADGCGGQSQGQEACAAGNWEWWYRGTGLGGGGTSTSSVIMLACVQAGTATRLPDASCGPMPGGSPSPCLVGQSYQTQLPACGPAVGPQVKYPATVDGFWGAGSGTNF